MELKGFQKKAIQQFQKYLSILRTNKLKAQQLEGMGLDVDYDWVGDAWKKYFDKRTYRDHIDGRGRPVPTVCLQVPTGGGKTLLAVKSIDAINNIFRESQTGLVLWVVPSTQIYEQTYRALRNRTHPYRVNLDLASAGKTVILDKDSVFTPDIIANNLAVLLLMLPSANRENKDTLKLFKDKSGFDEFFPPEDAYSEHEALYDLVPNLGVFNNGLNTQVKTSLGNVLRLLNPIIILDEGHKAYSELAQDTLYSFNPCFVLELSATPKKESNVLVMITGKELLRDDMIKLDINLFRQVSSDWRDAVRDSVIKRDQLEETAKRYKAKSGVYIRPICLIQAERTGKDKRVPPYIHALDVFDYLVKSHNIPPEQVAIKSSDRNDIENMDLLDENCEVRYIITKQALQEGWDCSFAYILTILTNPESKTGITQLVGRILRQPYGQKTAIDALDESYVFCYRDTSNNLVQSVRLGLMEEGLSDALSRLKMSPGPSERSVSIPVPLKEEYGSFAGQVFLPAFVVQDKNGGWREVRYEVDVLSRIKWDAINLSAFEKIILNPTGTQDVSVKIGLEPGMVVPIKAIGSKEMLLDLAFITRQLSDLVPNPWVAYEYADEAISLIRLRGYKDDDIAKNLGFIIETIKKEVRRQRDEQAQKIFEAMCQTKELRFFLISGCAGNSIPERIWVPNGRRLRTETDTDLQRTLFDFVMEDDFNSLEKAVALYLDNQQWILAWYKNATHLGYSIQGWREYRVHPDFIAFYQEDEFGSSNLFDEVWVLETKGLHLKNEDTDYKQQLFDLCNKMSTPTPWNAIQEKFDTHKVHFQVIFEDEWQQVINEMLSCSNKV